jgi:hypothetical protein
MEAIRLPLALRLNRTIGGQHFQVRGPREGGAVQQLTPRRLVAGKPLPTPLCVRA